MTIVMPPSNFVFRTIVVRQAGARVLTQSDIRWYSAFTVYSAIKRRLLSLQRWSLKRIAF